DACRERQSTLARVVPPLNKAAEGKVPGAGKVGRLCAVLSALMATRAEWRPRAPIARRLWEPTDMIVGQPLRLPGQASQGVTVSDRHCRRLPKPSFLGLPF